MDEKRRIKELTGRDVYVPEYEDVKRSDRVNSAGRACYVERNYWMIDESQIIVCYIKKSQGGTAQALKYGEQEGLPIRLI